jgi:predicted N-acyltransferase
MGMPTSAACATTVKAIARIGEIEAGAWDACANPDTLSYQPFVSHAFLKALEDAGAVGGRTGWAPRHLILEDNGTVAGVAPCYLKSHSQGEYVFDHGWADAYQHAGGRYYPKLQIAVPFTPVPGRRLLVRPGPHAEMHEQLLARAAIKLAKNLQLSSLHITFLDHDAWQRLGALGLLRRTGQQFHWRNQCYATFDDFLSGLASRKRKAVRKERAQALASGITITWLRGREITESHWDSFFTFYMDTGSRKWGRPYLNRAFFSRLGETMADHCLLVVARRAKRYIAGALNLIGSDCLYGRYWGAVEQHPCLHFEVCYYQAIEFAIAHKLARVEAGAQGEHKLARGYLPVPTYSSHWIADPGFRRAVARYLDEERAHIAEQREMLSEFTPYKKVIAAEDA